IIVVFRQKSQGMARASGYFAQLNPLESELLVDPPPHMFPAATQAEVKLSRPPSSSGVSTMSISTQTKTKSPQHRHKLLLRPHHAGFEVVRLAFNGEHQVVASRAIRS